MVSNYLMGKRAYLSAPIEYASGTNWRPEVVKVLTERFGIDLFDPFADPKQQWASLLRDAKEKQDWKTVSEIARSFVRKDLCMVDRADFLIAFLPYRVPTTGTVHEIINAVNAKKPVLLVADGNDLSRIPSWYWGFIPVEAMFDSFESLYKYLDEVNNGLHKSNNRWAYTYGLV